MNAEQLVRAGKLDEAIQALIAYLRDNPGDAKNRIFLFELLCFNGEYDRADKHLAMIAQSTKDAQIGALLYHGAIHAERIRRDMFEKKEYPGPLPAGDKMLRGKLNSKPFASLSDADPRLGARLEVFAAGDYMWIPLKSIERIEMGAPSRLRDLMWTPAKIKTAAGFEQRELGEVLLPALSPLSYTHPDEEVRLGRVSEWCADEAGNEAPYGQKMLEVDGEEFPLLELRSLEIESESLVQ